MVKYKYKSSGSLQKNIAKYSNTNHNPKTRPMYL